MSVYTRVLGVPLEDELREAVSALADIRDDVEWVLPAGTHHVAELSLNHPEYRLSLRCSGDCELVLESGILQIEGEYISLSGISTVGSIQVLAATIALDRVRATVTPGVAINIDVRGWVRGSHVTCDGGSLVVSGDEIDLAHIEVNDADAAVGLDVDGNTVSVSSTRVKLATTDGETCVGALLTGESVTARDLTIEDVIGAQATGLEVTGDVVRLAGIVVENVTVTGSPPRRPGIGIAAEARELEITGARVTSVSGEDAIGIRALACARDEARLFAVDLRAEQIVATHIAAGLLLGSALGLSLRGFGVDDVRGDTAVGLAMASGDAPEVSVGRVNKVIGSGGTAAGVRILSLPSTRATTVRDVAIEAIGMRLAGDSGSAGLPLSATTGAPPEAWDDWTRAVQTALATGAPPGGGRWRAGALATPWPPRDSDIAGLHVGLAVEDDDPLVTQGAVGALHIEGVSLRRIAGAALEVQGGTRAVRLGRIETYLARLGGCVWGETVLAYEMTSHLLGAGFRFGPGEVRLYDTILTDIAGALWVLDPDAELAGVLSTFTNETPIPDSRLAAIGIPYVNRGATTLPATLDAGEAPLADSVDLRLLSTIAPTLHAASIPGVVGRAFVGAHEPAALPACDLRDPEPRPAAPAKPAVRPSPAANYLARDASDLLALMVDRARVSMPTWTERGPADFTSMLFELLAERLDHRAYAQERAVAEGFLEVAALRRSVEDHARALDCEPDRGLSATAMIRVTVDDDVLSSIDPVRIPAGTLVANATTEEASIVFATESPLDVLRGLDKLALAADCELGATSARLLHAPGIEELRPGRWLVFWQGTHEPGHVVRVTAVEGAGETTLVRWDPRRPSPRRFSAGGEVPAEIYANVVPAHHGVPLRALGAGELDPELGRFRALLTFDVDGEAGQEIALPLGPVSVQSRGYPLPESGAQRGDAELRVSIDGIAWTRVESLSLAGPTDEVFVLRFGEEGSATLRFGDGVNGAALPARTVQIDLDLTIGTGRAGNVGAGRLRRLISLPNTDLAASIHANWGTTDEDVAATVRRLVAVDNPLPAVGGRDPEALDHLRYRVPFVSAEAESAITPADYERLLTKMPSVAATRARVVDGIQPLVRTTVLLRDEDTLDDDERLRRWAEVRRRLEEVKLLGFDVEAAPPVWVPLDLDVVVDADPHADASGLHDAVTQAITGQGGLLDPDQIGLGGDLHLSELHRAVLGVDGVSSLRVKRFRRLEQGAREWLTEGVIPIGADEVASRDGVLTVTVCGGLR